MGIFRLVVNQSWWEDMQNMENEMNKKIEDKNNERGLAAIEYVIMAALMIAAVVAAVGLFGPKLNNAFTNMGNKLENASK